MSSVDVTIYTPGIGTLSSRSYLLEGEFKPIFCSQCHSQFSNFSFHQAPITAGWAEAVWNEKFARHFYMTSSGNRTSELLILSPMPYIHLSHMLPYKIHISRHWCGTFCCKSRIYPKLGKYGAHLQGCLPNLYLKCNFLMYTSLTITTSTLVDK